MSPFSYMPPRRRWIPLAGVVFASLIAALALFLTISRQSQEAEVTREFTVALRNGLVTNCERNGNPLREGVQTLIRDQIQQSEAGLESGQYERFFPNIPPAELRQLIEEQNAKRREIIKTIAPVDCEEIYPKP